MNTMGDGCPFAFGLEEQCSEFRRGGWAAIGLYGEPAVRTPDSSGADSGAAPLKWGTPVLRWPRSDGFALDSKLETIPAGGKSAIDGE